jgi:hypothetical protein
MLLAPLLELKRYGMGQKKEIPITGELHLPIMVYRAATAYLETQLLAPQSLAISRTILVHGNLQRLAAH